jgi:aminoglycoside 6'-N-acetyltransferase
MTVLMPDDTPRPDRVAFRSLAADDLHALLHWLADPDVHRWYDEGELTLANITARFTPAIDGSEPTHGFLIVIDGQPAGYIQAYAIGDHPDYQRQLDIDPRAVATDLFIGDAAFRNRGWGAVVLAAFLDRVVFREMGAALAMIAPDPANARAIRAYERAGFQWVKTVPVVDEEHPENTGDEYVMLLRREDFAPHLPSAKTDDPGTT